MTRINNHEISNDSEWDLIIIGGGATGLGVAVDAATRGYRTLLLEQSDFAKGTSSRSTKLVHGGVRYLTQGDIALVKHALKERGLMQQNAAHLVKKEQFIIPCYSYFDLMKYWIGLSFYDLLAGKYSFGKSKFLSKTATIIQMPGIKPKGLKGGVSYFDGKFDDARLAINLAQTAQKNGATLANYVKVIGLLKNETNEIVGLNAQDVITDENFVLNSKVVINATGIFVDEILSMHNPDAKPLVRPSQGVHVVFKKTFLNSESALMIPKTSDGRVLFAVPWHEHLLVGTTDTPIKEHSLEPRALKEETDFILSTAQAYFTNKPTEQDILTVFSGLRPLAAPTDLNTSSTKEISRDHKLMVSAKGLITITGGKWTTYRRMAEETVDLAIKEAGLPKNKCATEDLAIHGCTMDYEDHYLNIYGADKERILELARLSPELTERLHPDFPHIAAEVVWIVEKEMVETLEDVLSRRLRILFIDAKAAIEMAPKVATLVAKKTGKDEVWKQTQIELFYKLAKGYTYQM